MVTQGLKLKRQAHGQLLWVARGDSTLDILLPRATAERAALRASGCHRCSSQVGMYSNEFRKLHLLRLFLGLASPCSLPTPSDTSLGL